MKSHFAVLLALALMLLAGPCLKANQEKLIGYWSIDQKSVEALAATIDPKADEMGAKMAQMFLKLAARGIALEFTGTDLRQIQNGRPMPAQPYKVSSVDGDRITIEIGKETVTYAFIGNDQLETTLPGGKLAFRIRKMDSAAIDALKKKMELAASGPAADAPAEERFQWLLAAPADQAGQYLSRHPDLASQKNARGETLLHLAARSRKRDLATRLIEAGADRTAKDNEGRTPFHWSLDSTFDPQLSKLLYADTIDLNAPYRGKNTLLAAAIRKPDLEKAAFLCELGAAPDEGKPAGEKTLFLLAIEKSDLPAAKLLLKHGANLDHRVFQNEQSALHVAARYGSLETIQFLLDQGMSVTIPNKAKDTPLTEVRFRDKDKIEVVKLLVKAGANLDENASFGGSLLSQAINRADNEFAKALVEIGADFDTKTGTRPSAYETARSNGNTELLALMDARRAAAAKRSE